VRTQLDALEAESIFILREVIAQFENPVLMYSIGKDSSVLLHLLAKAMAPAPIRMSVLHIDTLWKFREMIEFRTRIQQQYQLSLQVYTNPRGAELGVSPLTSSALHTQVMKTEALRLALDAGQFDAVIGGARRDEEASRAKERIFSFRDRNHQWDPKAQRPEFWRLFNTELAERESVRVFPLSNWTELDIWRYIRREQIPVVPLYFAKPRPVVFRAGGWIMQDDARLALRPGEQLEQRSVRFRTLGCYPLTAAIESTAASLDEIIAEMEASRFSERQGRLIDQDRGSSMEAKKREGYF
jgi:sulfate adenylyltransferase subunit 2